MSQGCGRDLCTLDREVNLNIVDGANECRQTDTDMKWMDVWFKISLRSKQFVPPVLVVG
jgi:hypothetical protein